MSLVALDGTPLVIVGAPARNGLMSVAGLNSILLDATGESLTMFGRIFTEDGGSHTIDTTGSSSFGFRTGTVSATWNAATVLKLGVGTMDTANGPPARATNVANVITFSASKSYTGGAAPASASWIDVAPDAGTMTIANGDLVGFSIQMVTEGGTDSFNATVQATATGGSGGFPAITTFLSAAYAAAARIPNVVITFSDGKLGFFAGGYVASVGTTTQTWNNGSSPNEYGNFFQLPVPTKVYGIASYCAVLGDVDFVLYSDPLGTPVAEKTVSFDLNVIGATTGTPELIALFSSPYTTTASQPLAGIMKPTSGTNITSAYMSFNASAHQKAYQLGTNCYAINRASGAFAAQNSNKDRYTTGLLIGAWDDGSGGGSTGTSKSRVFTGF